MDFESISTYRILRIRPHCLLSWLIFLIAFLLFRSNRSDNHSNAFSLPLPFHQWRNTKQIRDGLNFLFKLDREKERILHLLLAIVETEEEERERKKKKARANYSGGPPGIFHFRGLKSGSLANNVVGCYGSSLIFRPGQVRRPPLPFIIITWLDFHYGVLIFTL